MHLVYKCLFIHSYIHKNKNNISNDGTNPNTCYHNLPIAFLVIRGYMHYESCSLIIHPINKSAVLTPIIAEMISMNCLHRSMVEEAINPFCNVSVATNVP